MSFRSCSLSGIWLVINACSPPSFIIFLTSSSLTLLLFNRGCHARDRVIYLFLIIIYSKSRKLNFFLLIISICFNGMDLSYFIIAPKNVVVMFTELGFVSGGVCDECMHNTQGKNCEQCKPFYYRNPQRPITDPYVCLPCECDKVCC